MIETAWEKRKETLLADLEKSGNYLKNVLHQKLKESMTETMKMQERKIEDKLGECHRMKGISSIALSQNNSFSEFSVRTTIYI